MGLKLISVKKSLAGRGRGLQLRVHHEGVEHLACELRIDGPSRFVHAPRGNLDAGLAHTWAETEASVTGYSESGTPLFTLP